MRLSLRVLLAFSAVVGLAAFLVMRIFAQEVKPGVRQGMEVALQDTANLLAEVAAPELKAGTLQEGALARAVADYQARRPGMPIWGLEPGGGGPLRVYVTDARGRVVYDSTGEALGQDYSRWNDVHLTLRGQYGARSTRSDPADETSSVMHVGAPLKDGGRIIGCLTVAKATAAVAPFARRSGQRVWRAGFLLMGTALALGLLLVWSLSRSIGRLRAYARTVGQGGRAVLPRGGGPELSELARALGDMRERLEGRQYLERHVHTLTHEMKSPLAAIHGAVELLEDGVPEAEQRRFLANIREQEERLGLLLQRMLDLASLQQRQELRNPGGVDLAALARRVLEAKEAPLRARGLDLRASLAEGARVQGESFLLEQALSNLLDNAMDFADPGSTVEVALEPGAREHKLAVRNQGPALPDFAKDRVFEPFYSLPRPDGGRKGTGIGLSYVREIARLHGGEAGLEDRPGGVEAWLRLPAAK